jgi:hypothetical protein
MKKIFLLSIVLTIILVITGFSRKPKGKLQCLETKTHLTAHGDINFDLSGNSQAPFRRFNLNGKVAIGLMGIKFPKDSSEEFMTFNISMVGITKEGSYNFMPAQKDSSITSIAYSDGTKDLNTNFYSSYYAEGIMPGVVIINSISDTSINGTYTAKITNKEGKVLNFSGNFSGNFIQK